MTQPVRGRSARKGALSVALALSPDLHPIPTAPAPFVGRDQELAHALRQLEQRGVIALTGMAGSGKTALAAAIVQANDQPALWIDIRTDLIDGVDPLLWRLAQPLAAEEPGLWDLLNQAQQRSWNYPAVIRLQMILAAFARQNHELLICIDTLEAASDSSLAALLAGLCHYAANTTETRIKLIVIGRSLPYELELYALPPLQGLPPESIREWAQQRGLVLDLETAQAVYQRTAGNTLALERLLHPPQRDPIRLSDLAVSARVRSFIKIILEGLTDDERGLLAYLATRPDQRDSVPIERVMQLLRLEELQLVSSSPPNTILVHPIISLFFSSFTPGG